MPSGVATLRPWPDTAEPRPMLVVAEVAQTHDGSLGQAHAFIDAVAAAGADAIKFQTHIAAAESTPREPWRTAFSQQDATRFDYWRRMEFSFEQWVGLRQHASDRGLMFLSSPFSLDAVELLKRVGVSAWKVASGEVSNGPLLDAVSEGRSPVILSSGLSTYDELAAAVQRVRGRGAAVIVLQCTTEYPTPPERIGLNVLEELRERFACPVGLSDHSGSIFPGLAAATLGAAVLEVHVTLSREMFGPDVKASVTTAELAELVRGARFNHVMLTSAVSKLRLPDGADELRQIFTKSCVTRRAVRRGQRLSLLDLTFKKPGTGIPVERVESLVGALVLRDLPAGHFLVREDLALS